MEDLEKNYLFIPEEYLEDGAALLESEGEYDNSFRKMLNAAKDYRAANLTPIILYDFGSNSMVCIVKELYGKKLH